MKNFIHILFLAFFAGCIVEADPCDTECVPCEERLSDVAQTAYTAGEKNTRMYVGGVCGCVDSIGIPDIECRTACITFPSFYTESQILEVDSINLNYFTSSLKTVCQNGDSATVLRKAMFVESCD